MSEEEKSTKRIRRIPSQSTVQEDPTSLASGIRRAASSIPGKDLAASIVDLVAELKNSDWATELTKSVARHEAQMNQLGELKRAQNYADKWLNILTTHDNVLQKLITDSNVLEGRLTELTKVVGESTDNAKAASKLFSEEIAAAKRTLHEHTRLTAPVDLWHEKREEHVNAQQKHQRNFQWSLFVIGVLALAILSVAVFSPNLIDQLLTPVGCDPLLPETCRGISSRSILGGATILTFFTVLLWFTRLQMKLYLAERHLALDARERIAFSRSYVGLLAEGDTSEEAKQQRSLVYAALFRPSSDGAIKEEGGLDPAISAAISKLLTK